MPFSVVVTSTEHYWVTLAEHRSPRGKRLPTTQEAKGIDTGGYKDFSAAAQHASIIGEALQMQPKVRTFRMARFLQSYGWLV
jgi:hypothetical protein